MRIAYALRTYEVRGTLRVGVSTMALAQVVVLGLLALLYTDTAADLTASSLPKGHGFPSDIWKNCSKSMAHSVM